MKKSVLRLLPYGILVFAILFIVIGMMHGEQETVLQKAIHICLECIGIG